MLFTLISFAIAFVAATLSFREARAFVRKRLRFVDAVQSPMAPILAGLGATLLVGILAPIIPFVGFGTALSVGVAVGMGVSTGAKDAKNGYYIAE